MFWVFRLSKQQCICSVCLIEYNAFVMFLVFYPLQKLRVRRLHNVFMSPIASQFHTTFQAPTPFPPVAAERAVIWSLPGVCAHVAGEISLMENCCSTYCTCSPSDVIHSLPL